MYWTDSGRGKLQSAQIGGGTSEAVDILEALANPVGLVLDTASAKLYYSDVTDKKIARANVDGTELEDVVTGLTGPAGIALDIELSQVYWADLKSGGILRSGTDGRNQAVVVRDIDEPFGLALR